jgi:hypothetical protein
LVVGIRIDATGAYQNFIGQILPKKVLVGNGKGISKTKAKTSFLGMAKKRQEQE